ncbi:hypothetical protein ANO14919_130650 [Xylariales sp. No.14919]|nr:hypothetical protein ANO14919_130650 [Xylariales sp. No.14919]
MKSDTVGSQARGSVNVDSNTDESEESGDHEKRQRELEAQIEKQKKKAKKYSRRIAGLEGERAKLRAASHKHRIGTRQATERMREEHADQLKEEKDARQKAERERDEHKNQLAILRAATAETLAQNMVLKETQQEAMRKAVTDVMYEHEKQVEAIRRREAEERDKMVAETKLEGERRIDAIFRAMAAERQTMLATRNQEERIFAKVSKADNEEKVSLLVARKLAEAAQAARGVGIKSNDNIAEQEAMSQAERQELQRRLGLESKFKAEVESHNSQDESGKQPQEDSQEEIRKWAADEVQKQANGASLLHFTDALGRKFVFPFETCRAWADMEDLIKQVFSYDDVIGPHVQAGHYHLMLDDAIILPQLWEFSVEPGCQVTMHMWPTTPTEITNSESRSSQGSSDFNVEHSIPEVQDSNGESPSRVSSRIGSSDSRQYHPQDHIPPPVPEAPLSHYERSPSPAWPAQSVSPASSLPNISRVGSEGPELESIFGQSGQSNNVSSYSIEQETASRGSSVSRPRSRRRFRSHLSTWRWRRFPIGVAKTVTSSSGSGAGEARSSNGMAEGEGAEG